MHLFLQETKMKKNKAIIITIGDELLIGQTVDTNSTWMAKHLNEIDIDVIKRVAVGDNKKDIVATLNNAIKNAEIVLITGGLGPTADDITKPLLCEYFGSKLVMNDAALENVKRIFAKRNFPLLERNRQQAEVPENCKVLQNSKGTAPGMWFEKDESIIVSMPGVPVEMMSMMENDILPALSSKNDREAIVHRHIMTAGIGESFLAEKIATIESSLPSYIKLAYLPVNWMVKLRLTAKGKNEHDLAKETEAFQKLIAEAISEYVITLSDEQLELILHKNFIETKQTLALAESCTGGYVGHTITQVEGASTYFLGSIVSYDTSVKENILGISREDINRNTEVSEDVAKQMAEKVRIKLNADIGFGVTGWLSSSSKQAESDTGIVWIAVSNDKRTETKRFYFPYDRMRNKELALQMSLLTIWKFINDKPI